MTFSKLVVRSILVPCCLFICLAVLARPGLAFNSSESTLTTLESGEGTLVTLERVDLSTLFEPAELGPLLRASGFEPVRGPATNQRVDRLETVLFGLQSQALAAEVLGARPGAEGGGSSCRTVSSYSYGYDHVTTNDVRLPHRVHAWLRRTIWRLKPGRLIFHHANLRTFSNRDGQLVLGNLTGVDRTIFQGPAAQPARNVQQRWLLVGLPTPQPQIGRIYSWEKPRQAPLIVRPETGLRSGEKPVTIVTLRDLSTPRASPPQRTRTLRILSGPAKLGQ